MKFDPNQTIDGRKYKSLKFVRTAEEANLFMVNNPEYKALHESDNGIYMVKESDTGRPAAGLLVYTYRCPAIGDCTAGGLSAKHDKFILTGEGIPEIFAVAEDTPELKVVRRILRGEVYLHAEPMQAPGIERWPMSGGNAVYTSDSRFPNSYPIKIHDRFEG